MFAALVALHVLVCASAPHVHAETTVAEHHGAGHHASEHTCDVQPQSAQPVPLIKAPTTALPHVQPRHDAAPPLPLLGTSLLDLLCKARM